MTTISFPSLGIDTFSVDPVAFTIPIFGGISVRWYALIIMCGIILAFLYCAYRTKQENILFDDLLDMMLFGVPIGIIGARIYYVIMKWDTYDGFWDRIAIWNGGIAIYGAIIAGGITVFLVCRHKKIPFFKMADIAAPAVMIGQILGRWGNFINGEAHGYAVAEGSPLYFIRMGLSHGSGAMHYYHPTFLYESLWNLMGFVIINALYKKKKFDGQLFLMYVSWYGFGRMWIEGLRTDSLMIGNTVRVSQLVAFLCFIIGTALLVLGFIGVKKGMLTVKAYTPTKEEPASDSHNVSSEDIDHSLPNKENEDTQNLPDNTPNDIP